MRERRRGWMVWPNMPSATLSSRYAVIVPACNEEPCLAGVLAELRDATVDLPLVVAVGVNGSSDRTAEIARSFGVLVAETAHRGYGYGCKAAIDLIEREHAPVDAYVFFAADGANDPRDIPALLAARERGFEMVLGSRTTRAGNWSALNLHYVAANRLFGAFCGLLTGRFFSDLGPLRLMERELYRSLQLCEWTYGWTIEAQVRAAMLKARIIEVPVRERGRSGGEQKVSHVSWRQTLRIGYEITAAAVRARFRGRGLGSEPDRRLERVRPVLPGSVR